MRTKQITFRKFKKHCKDRVEIYREETCQHDNNPLGKCSEKNCLVLKQLKPIIRDELYSLCYRTARKIIKGKEVTLAGFNWTNLPIDLICETNKILKSLTGIEVKWEHQHDKENDIFKIRRKKT